MAGGSSAAGWGAALQSLGGNALSYLMRMDEQRRQDQQEAELRKERALAAKMRDAQQLLMFNKEGYEPFEAAASRGDSLQALAPVGAGLEGIAPGVGVPGVGRAMQYLSAQGAGQAQASLEQPIDVPFSDGSSRRMVLNPDRTPEAMADRRQERNLDAQLARTNATALAKRDADYTEFQRKNRGYYNLLVANKVIDPAKTPYEQVQDADLEGDFKLFLQNDRQLGQRDIALIGAIGRLADGAGQTANRVALAESRADLRAAQGDYDDMLRRRPRLDDFVSDKMVGASAADSAAWRSAAGTWRAGDSIPKAERLDEAAVSHRTLQEALGLRPPSPEAAEEALREQAKQKEDEINAGGNTPGEKVAMVFEVRRVLAEELRKLRGGRR